jgi:hypothetical protein
VTLDIREQIFGTKSDPSADFDPAEFTASPQFSYEARCYTKDSGSAIPIKKCRDFGIAASWRLLNFHTALRAFEVCEPDSSSEPVPRQKWRYPLGIRLRPGSALRRGLSLPQPDWSRTQFVPSCSHASQVHPVRIKPSLPRVPDDCSGSVHQQLKATCTTQSTWSACKERRLLDLAASSRSRRRWAVSTASHSDVLLEMSGITGGTQMTVLAEVHVPQGPLGRPAEVRSCALVVH